MSKSLKNEDKLKVAVLSDTQKICSEVGEMINVEYDSKTVELISELVWKKLKLYGTELELFAKHAKRSGINGDDVKLLVRNNDSLKTYINEVAANTKIIKKKKKDDKK